MEDRRLCPFHEESTPSCVVYSDGYRCYGCGKHGPLAELGIAADAAPKEKYVEDIKARLDYISTLPQVATRGFTFPTDRAGYYIVWPDRDYYKLRLHDHTLQNDKKASSRKYKNPAGRRQPLFWVARRGSRTLIIAEGEINGMSLAKAFSDYDVVCPGSASEISSDRQGYHLTQYTKYANILIVTDRDGPGTAAAISLKSLLLGKVPRVSIVLMSPDANEIYVKDGEERLRNEVERRML